MPSRRSPTGSTAVGPRPGTLSPATRGSAGCRGGSPSRVRKPRRGRDRRRTHARGRKPPSGPRGETAGPGEGQRLPHPGTRTSAVADRSSRANPPRGTRAETSASRAGPVGRGLRRTAFERPTSRRGLRPVRPERGFAPSTPDGLRGRRSESPERRRTGLAPARPTPRLGTPSFSLRRGRREAPKPGSPGRRRTAPAARRRHPVRRGEPCGPWSVPLPGQPMLGRLRQELSDGDAALTDQQRPGVAILRPKSREAGMGAAVGA